MKPQPYAQQKKTTKRRTGDDRRKGTNLAFREQKHTPQLQTHCYAAIHHIINSSF